MTIQDLILNPNLSKVPAYVPGKSIEELKRELGIEEVIKLGSNENTLGPSPKAIQAIKQAAAEINQYPSVEVYDLRCQLAKSLGSEFSADHVIVGNGSADIILALGMRIGYGIARKELIGYLLHTQSPFHSGKIGLIAAQASLEDHGHVEKTQKNNAEGKAYLYRSFKEMDIDYLPSQANYIMLINLPYSVQSINQALLSRGIIIRPTAPFGIPEALRVTIGTLEENKQLVEGFKEVLAELGQLQ